MNNGTTKYLYRSGSGWQVKVGSHTLGSFPAEAADLARQLAEEAAKVAPSSFQQLADKYYELKKARGLRGKRKAPSKNGGAMQTPALVPIRHDPIEPPPSDIDERLGSIRISYQERELRADFTIGHAVADVDRHISTLPLLIDQARDAEKRAQKAQAEVGALWLASDRAWGRVAEAILGLGSEGLAEALAAALAAKRGGGE